MSITIEDICSELRKRHKVDEFFYPDLSMDIEVPNGLNGEVTENIKILQKNGFGATAENIFLIMELKRQLLIKYRNTKKGKKVLEDYRQLLMKAVKPVGTTIPTDFMFVTILIGLLSYVVARFAGSFADETGKIMARRLLENDKKLSKEHNLTINEYEFLKNQAIILIQNGRVVNTLSKQLKKKKVGKTS
jgi:hypothetical protein